MGVIAEARQHRCFIAQCYIQSVGIQDCVLFARIHAALEHDVADQLIGGYTKSFDDRSFDVIVVMVERQFDFGEAEHKLFNYERFDLQVMRHYQAHHRF